MISRRLVVLAGVPILLAVLLAVFAVSAFRADPVDAAGATLVPEQPRQGLPVAANGAVYDTVQVGYRVYVAGDFTSVALPDGTTVAQPYLFAYDIDSGAYIHDFDPVIENGSVKALDVTADGQHLIIGGSFTRIDGRWRVRLAKLDLDGEVDLTFIPDVDAEVEAVAVGVDTVYLGGNFMFVNGASRSQIAAVTLSTGATVANFDFPITNAVGRAGSGAVKAMDLSPDGSKLVAIYNSLTVAGQDRGGVAVFNVAGTPSLDDWQTTIYRDGYPNCSGGTLLMRDVEISPDGTYFVVVTSGHDYPPACDTANAFPINGGANTQPLWVTRMFDSTFSVAISDVAVYVGGHFCFTEGPNSPDYGFDIYPNFTKPQSCENGTAGANQDVLPWVARRQIAALDPATGWALDWNPGSNATVAVYSLEMSDRGLMLGQDNDRVNQILTGRHAFFDFGSVVDTTPPEVTVTSPQSNGDITGEALTLSGGATDNYRVDSVTVRLHNIDEDVYLQDDGSLAAGANTTGAAVAASAASTTWSLDVAGLTPGTYYLDTWALDRNGNTNADFTRRTFIVPFASPTCAVTLTDNGNPELTWTPVAGVSKWAVRRDGSWVSTVNNALSHVDSGLIPGDYTYVVRYTAANGVKNDIACSPSPITVAGNQNTTPACTAVLVDGNVELEWNNLPGVDSYQLRRDGSWIGSVGDVSEAVDVNVAVGTYDYAVRHRSAGVNIDTPCGTIVVDGAAPGCVATVNGSEVTLIWEAIAGEDSFAIRRDGSWAASVGDVTTYTETRSAGTYAYSVRYFDGGAVDLACGTVTVVGGGAPSCTATVVGDDVVLTWSAIAGEDRFIVRRDGSWAATVVGGAVTYTDQAPTPGTHTYIVRWYDGPAVNLDCGTVTV